MKYVKQPRTLHPVRAKALRRPPFPIGRGVVVGQGTERGIGAGRGVAVGQGAGRGIGAGRGVSVGQDATVGRVCFVKSCAESEWHTTMRQAQRKTTRPIIHGKEPSGRLSSAPGFFPKPADSAESVISARRIVFERVVKSMESALIVEGASNERKASARRAPVFLQWKRFAVSVFISRFT